MTERLRDIVTGELTLDYFVRRSAEGWRMASIEWVREGSSATATPRVPDKLVEASVPYGLRVAENGLNLEENPLESTVLLLILDQIVQEKRISEIAFQLNQRGYLTRDGSPWSPTAVFNLMPRLIEAGPALLKSAAWQERRHTH
ncbi:MAG TPA: recombinase family protein [Bryobacteraceae bacterium]